MGLCVDHGDALCGDISVLKFKCTDVGHACLLVRRAGCEALGMKRSELSLAQKTSLCGGGQSILNTRL